jgi:hypothetical protein
MDSAFYGQFVQFVLASYDEQIPTEEASRFAAVDRHKCIIDCFRDIIYHAQKSWKQEQQASEQDSNNVTEQARAEEEPTNLKSEPEEVTKAFEELPSDQHKAPDQSTEKIKDEAKHSNAKTLESTRSSTLKTSEKPATESTSQEDSSQPAPTSKATSAQSSIPIRTGNPFARPSPEQVAQAQSEQKEKPMVPQTPDVRIRIANAKVGDGYDQPINIESKADVLVQNIVGLEVIGGLVFDVENQRITGKAKNHGDFTLYLTLLVKNRPLSWCVTHKLVVIPDPKTLWKNLPSNESAPFWKPDSKHSGMTVDEHYSVAAASQRGRGHAQEGSCRDDDFHLRKTTNTGWHVLSVSDGAGSAEYSREASRIASERCADLLSSKLEEMENDHAICLAFSAWINDPNETNHHKLQRILFSCLSRPVYDTIREIKEISDRNELHFRQFYTTLLIGAHKEIHGKHCIFGYWRGDGAMAHHIPGEYLKPLGEPDSGDYGGQTRFLDMQAADQDDINSRIVFDAYDKFGTLLLMTDGVSDPMFHSDEDLKKQKAWDAFWTEQIKDLLSQDATASAERMLSWMDFWSQGNHDDRTLAILYRTEDFPDEAGLSGTIPSPSGSESEVPSIGPAPQSADASETLAVEDASDLGESQQPEVERAEAEIKNVKTEIENESNTSNTISRMMSSDKETK